MIREMKNFDKAVEVTLSYEGGFVDHPKDPGGATFRGVSLRAIKDLVDENGRHLFDLDGDGDVDREDVLALKAAWEAGNHELILGFYRRRYWDAIRGDEMKWPICLLVFDSAVNSGPAAAIKQLQRAMGLKDDGQLGPKTLAKAKLAGPNTVVDILVQRSILFSRIAAAKGETFLAGWMARLFRLHAEALSR